MSPRSDKDASPARDGDKDADKEADREADREPEKEDEPMAAADDKEPEAANGADPKPDDD